MNAVTKAATSAATGTVSVGTGSGWSCVSVVGGASAGASTGAPAGGKQRGGDEHQRSCQKPAGAKPGGPRHLDDLIDARRGKEVPA